ncbi:hypothetical protein [Mesorhizobium sp. L-8-3]|uniref:hypothetical protein n=1 Tax=Mesorhizobium sp. L-8-3 TaxID=2744522 RepID=UPI001926BFF1|nr:hypothetical protein [Mesorhizobium sp. L-8-3]
MEAFDPTVARAAEVPLRRLPPMATDIHLEADDLPASPGSRDEGAASDAQSRA